MFARVINMQRFFLCFCLISTLLFAATGNCATTVAVTKQQAVTIAKSRFQGRVIAVEQSKQNNTDVYRVKVLDKKGGMHTVVIDNKTGQVISAH